LRVLKNKGAYVTILTNGGSKAVACDMTFSPSLHPTTLWGSMAAAPSGTQDEEITLQPEATLVQLWK
jgi:hypothetical protein